MMMQRAALLFSASHTTKRRLTLSHRSLSSVLGIPKDELDDIREHLRRCSGPNENSITLQDASSTLPQLKPGAAQIMTLSNPKARNALTGKMMAEMADCVDNIETDHENLSALIVRGYDGFWCAGADLGVAKDSLMTKEGGRIMSALMTDTLTRLRQLPIITIAAVEGVAIGGGAELLTAMDCRIAKDDATIRFVHANMGVTPGWGGATRLIKLVGRQRALQLLGTAQPISAVQAFEMCLVDTVVDSGNDSAMDETLVQFLKPFIHKDSSVLHAAKRAVSGAHDAESFEAATKNEHDVFCSMWGGPANQAALKKASLAPTRSKSNNAAKPNNMT